MQSRQNRIQVTLKIDRDTYQKFRKQSESLGLYVSDRVEEYMAKEVSPLGEGGATNRTVLRKQFVKLTERLEKLKLETIGEKQFQVFRKAFIEAGGHEKTLDNVDQVLPAVFNQFGRDPSYLFFEEYLDLKKEWNQLNDKLIGELKVTIQNASDQENRKK
jgi:hypothetical protein